MDRKQRRRKAVRNKSDEGQGTNREADRDALCKIAHAGAHVELVNLAPYQRSYQAIIYRRMLFVATVLPQPHTLRLQTKPRKLEKSRFPQYDPLNKLVCYVYSNIKYCICYSDFGALFFLSHSSSGWIKGGKSWQPS